MDAVYCLALQMSLAHVYEDKQVYPVFGFQNTRNSPVCSLSLPHCLRPSHAETAMTGSFLAES